MNEQGNTLLHALTSNLGWPAKSVWVRRYLAQMRSTGTFGDAKLQEEVSGRDARHGEGEGRDVMGEFIKMAGDARIHRWTDEQVDCPQRIMMWKSVLATRFRFALKELPIKGHYRFSVRPIECFGKKGASISSDIVLVEDDL